LPVIRAEPSGRIPVVMVTNRAARRSVRAVPDGAEPNDATLLARVLAGDETALAVAYDRYAGLVYGLARRVTRDAYLAQDITQDVFAYLWELPDRVDLSKGTLRSYLAVVAHRRAVDEVRRSERRNRVETTTFTVEVTDGPEGEVVDAAACEWRRRHITEVLAQLPEEQRRAVSLAYYEGQTYVQVARTLGIPEGTAKSRLRLALGRLRTLLGDELGAVT
jgi:RNA polymerase sigma-70 factor (ECF subfamily)